MQAGGEASKGASTPVASLSQSGTSYLWIPAKAGGLHGSDRNPNHLPDPIRWSLKMDSALKVSVFPLLIFMFSDLLCFLISKLD